MSLSFWVLPKSGLCFRKLPTLSCSFPRSSALLPVLSRLLQRLPLSRLRGRDLLLSSPVCERTHRISYQNPRRSSEPRRDSTRVLRLCPRCSYSGCLTLCVVVLRRRQPELPLHTFL